MSASNPNKGFSPRPLKKRYEWNAEKGQFKYWDGEKDVFTDKVVGIIIDTDVNVIGGYSDALGSGLFSNYFSDSNKDHITVRSSSSKRIVPGCEGVYSAIKKTINSFGGVFHKALMLYNPKDDEVISLEIKGTAFSEWIEFESLNNNNTTLKVLVASKGQTKTKGGKTFFVPKFSLSEVQDATNKDKAIQKDRELQQWLFSKDTGYDKDDVLEKAEDLVKSVLEPEGQKEVLDNWKADDISPDDDLPF